MPDFVASISPAFLVAFCVGIVGLIGCEASPDGSRTSITMVEDEGVPALRIEGLWDSDWPHVPSLEVDTVISPSDGDELGLVAPLHAAILAGGRIVIADAGTRRVWIASDAGGWTAGPGPGPGPGELRSIGGVWSADEGFVVHDRQTGDLVRFDGNGEWIDRTGVGIEHAAHGSGDAFGTWVPSVQHLGGGEWLVAVPRISSVRSDGPTQTADAQFVWVFGHPAEREVPLGAGPLRPLFVEGGGGAPIPYAQSAYVAAASGSVVMFRGVDPSVEQLGPDGATTRRIRWTDPPQALGESHREALGEFMRASAPSEMPSQALEGMIATLRERLPLPERLPYLGDLRLGGDGAIWLGWPERSGLETPTEPELVREWRVVPPAAWAGQPQVLRVTLPDGATLLGPATEAGVERAPGWSGAVGRGAFFLLLRDEMGRQGIGVLRYGATTR